VKNSTSGILAGFHPQMRVARWFIYGFPVFLLLLVAASFWNSASLTSDKKNEMSLGVLGEPSTLNPIQQADGAASQVAGSLFNGLLKYNADLEIIGDLAESWSLDQTTTLFFKNEESAAAAKVQLESLLSEWSAWALDDVKQSGRQLLLHFAEPGLESSEKIVSLLPAESLAPLATLRVEVKENSADTLQRLSKDLRSDSILRMWVDSGAAFEITADPALKADIEEWLTANGGGTVQAGETLTFLAEPQVVFHLRKNVRWHDGAPFTSRDASFTYRAIMDDATASPRKPDFDLILKVETPDDFTFRVTYRKPYSPALESWMISLLPAHLLEGKPTSWWTKNFNRTPIGTGAFRFAEWKTNEFIRVERNPDYFDAPGPWMDGIVYRFMPDQLTLRLAFETKQVDFWSAEPWTVNAFVDDPRFNVFTTPTSSYTYIGWNLKRPLFQDPLVRRALAHAVDVPSMVRFILYGHGLQSTGLFTPQMWFFNPEIKPFAYDPAKARTLLAEAGWKPGADGILQKNGERFSFTLITNNGNEVRRDIATLTQDGLKQLGIEVKVELYEWAVFLKNHINKGDFDAMVLGWALGNGYDQYQIWHSSQTNPEQLNVVGYKSAKADRLLDEIRQEYNRGEIIRIAGELQRTIYEDQPYLFLYVPEGTSVMWRDAYRIRRPDGKGGWIDSPVEMTKAGWAYWSDWFYRPEFSERLPSTSKP
jgi:peptide/nickel transport system substrate-binding protein